MPRKRRKTDRKRSRRQSKHDGNWTKEMDYLLKRMFTSCVVCGRKRNLTRDHVKPLARGNGLEPGNVVILCQSCNSTKCSKPLDKLPKEMAEPIEKAAMDFKIAWEKLIIRMTKREKQ